MTTRELSASGPRTGSECGTSMPASFAAPPIPYPPFSVRLSPVSPAGVFYPHRPPPTAGRRRSVGWTRRGSGGRAAPGPAFGSRGGGAGMRRDFGSHACSGQHRFRPPARLFLKSRMRSCAGCLIDTQQFGGARRTPSVGSLLPAARQTPRPPGRRMSCCALNPQKEIDMVATTRNPH